MGWIFKTYCSPTGRNDVQVDIDGVDEEVREHFLTRLRYLANTPQIDWHEPQAKKLKGVENVYEIRFKAGNLQYRPLGYFGPREGEFTILVWAYKKQSVYTPAEAINTAGKRRKLLDKGEATCVALKVNGMHLFSA
jgi:phage-related protein